MVLQRWADEKTGTSNDDGICGPESLKANKIIHNLIVNIIGTCDETATEKKQFSRLPVVPIVVNT